MSDEAENASTKQNLDIFKSANEAKASLEGRMKALGDQLSGLAAALQTPGQYKFYVDESDSISVGRIDAPTRRAVSHIAPTDFSWAELCAMLSGYEQATEDKHGATHRLRIIGYPMEE
jgi:hypothetical protein